MSWGWSEWEFDGRFLYISRSGYEVYHIDLMKCGIDDAVRWDWVRHVAAKEWASDTILADLVRKLTRAQFSAEPPSGQL